MPKAKPSHLAVNFDNYVLNHSIFNKGLCSLVSFCFVDWLLLIFWGFNYDENKVLTYIKEVMPVYLKLV